MEICLTEQSIMLLSVGELSKRKNHEVIIKALSKIGNPHFHYYLVGSGNKETYLKELAINLGVESQVHFLGYRSDVFELCSVA